MSPAEWYARQRAKLVLKEAERHRAAGEVDAAVDAFDRAAELDSGVRRTAFDAAATLLLEHGRPADAIRPLQAITELDRKDAEAWRRLARVLREVGNHNAAIKAWRRVQDSDVRDLEANQALAEMLPQGSREIIAPLRVLAEAAASHDLAPWRRLATALQSAGEIDPAIATWGRVLAADPRDLEANQALLQMLPEGAPETIAPLRALAEAAGAADPQPWRRLARALQANGEIDPAITTWGRVLAADPGDLEANQALLRMLSEGAPETIAPLRALAEAAGAADPEPWRRLARVLQANGKGEEAFAAWGKVVAADARDVEANQAILRMLPEGAPGTIAPLRGLAEAAGAADPQPWRRLARVLQANGEIEPAIAAWGRVLAADPRDLDANQAILQMLPEGAPETIAPLRALAEAAGAADPEPWRRLARGLQANRKVKAALDAWGKVVAADPRDPEANQALVQMLPDGGAETIAPLRALAEAADGDPQPWRKLARVLQANGEIEPAIAAWDRVLAADRHDLEANQALLRMLPEGGVEALAPLGALAEAAGATNPQPWRRLAKALERNGQVEAAAEAWRGVLIAAPNDPGAHERLGVLLEELGRVEEAAAHQKAFAETDPSRTKPWKRYARTLEGLGRDAEAFQVWRRLAELEPGDHQAQARLAELLLAQGLKARAIAPLRAMAETGDDLGAWRRLARVLSELSRVGEAVAAWRKVLEIAPAELEAHAALAELLEADPAVALPHLRAVAEATPKSPEAWRALARALVSLGDTQGAVEAWRRLLKLDDGDIEAHAALAELVGDRKMASLPHLTVLVERGPDLVSARRRLALMLEKAGDKAGARQAFERLIEVAPEDPMPHEKLAELLAADGDAPGALVHLRWLAEAAPERDKAWRKLAAALKSLGEPIGEADVWRRLLTLLPADPQAHERLATLLEAQGRPADAAVHLRAAAEADPSKTKAWKRYARALEELGQGAEAFKVWRQVSELDPSDGHAHDRLAELLWEQGLKARALEHLRVLAEPSADRAAWRRLARALTELDHQADAIAAWGRVLEIAPAEVEAHRALAELLAHDPAEAAVHWLALADALPKTPEPWRGLARALAATGDASGAADAWRRLLKLEEDDLEAHAALADLVGDRKSAALPHLKVLAERGPDLAEARRRLAQLLEKTGDAAAAQAEWLRTIEVAPADPLPHERLAQLLADAGDAPGALEHLRWLTVHGPERERAFRKIAQAMRDAGDVEGEIGAWNDLLAAAPGEVAAHERLALLLDRQGRKSEAAAHLKLLAEQQPGEAKPWKRYARAIDEAGDAEAAVTAWRKVLTADPSDPHAHDELARLLQGLGRPAEAARHLATAAEREPDNLRRWRRLAAVLQEARDPEGEAEVWRRLIELDGSNSQARETLAQMLEAKGDLAGAAAQARALAEADPQKARPWRRLARLLDGAGDNDGALEAWGRVAELEPGDLAARERLAQLLLDLGRSADAAPHLEVLAGAEPGKSKGWRRLALALQDAGDADGEMAAWGHLLAAEENDLQAHERLAHLLGAAGREAEALPHLEAAVRIGPENARAWRRYARALNQSDKSAGELKVWRDTLALAGQLELEGQLRRTEEALQRAQELKQELQGAGAELKRERGSTQHALTRLEREERAHRATQGLLKDELAERRRLTAELQESTQRHRQAEAEEASHLLAGRLLGLLEPLTGAETLRGAQADEPAAYAEELLRSVAAEGALVVAGEADARLSGVDLVAPDALAAKLRGRAGRLIVLADRDAAARAEVRTGLAGRRGVTVLGLSELVIRRAAGVHDLKTKVEPVSDDVWPARPLMVTASDDGLRTHIVEGIGSATGLPFAPLFPMALAERVRARDLDLDDWLAAAWSAHGRPRAFGFQFDPETLALFAREIRAGRAEVMAKVFRRATALQLVWSDKALFAAADHFARSGGETRADFDAGDAQIEVKTFKRLVARDMLMESAFDQLGKFRPATVKAYRELFDKPALGRFCRDANLSLSVAGFAEVDERALGFMPSPELLRAGRLIGDAVQSLTAAREPEAPPQGLVQYGLGRSLEALGRHPEALEAYQEAVVRAPTYFPARAAAARYLELAGRPGEAERLLRQGLGNGTPDPDVQEGLLEFYQRNASPLGVAATSRLMLKRGQSRPAVAAPALIELGRWRGAEPLLQTLAPRIAGQDNFLNDLVDLPELAARLDQLTADAEIGEPAAQLRLAEALRRLGRLGDSLPWYRRALAETGVVEAETGVGAQFRPRFLMVGPPRTGTTLLRRLFDLHPQIAAPSGELFFFSSRTGQRAGSNRQRAPLAWYLSAFQAAAEKKPDARLVGEKTPHYFSTSDEQMAFASLLLPGVKIIATLRDPVVRAWSEIKVQRRVTEAEIVASLSEGGRPNWLGEILDAGRYAAHLKRWLQHVEPGQLLLVDSDALESNVVEEAGRIFRWLGVRELGRRPITELQQGWNNRTESFSPSAQVEALLRRSYEGEPWTAAEVARAVGISEAAADRPPSRRRAAAK